MIIAIKEKDKVVVGYSNAEAWGRLCEKDYVDEENLAIKFTEEGKLFAYFHDLGRLIPMPDSIMEHVILEYRGGRDARPELQVRILPDEENYYTDEIRKVYPGIFVRQKVLFEGEILEYRIYENRDGERCLAAEGSLSCDADRKIQPGSRFTALNEMGLCLSLNEESTLKEKMKKYLTDSAVMEELFPLI